MNYKIITVNTSKFIGTDFEKAAEHLAELVNSEIRQGWKPLGGVSVGMTQSTLQPYLFQAMIKE